MLNLECTLCEARDSFRGVLITLAADLACRAGWRVPVQPAELIKGPGEREETCPKCTDAMGA